MNSIGFSLFKPTIEVFIILNITFECSVSEMNMNMNIVDSLCYILHFTHKIILHVVILKQVAIHHSFFSF